MASDIVGNMDGDEQSYTKITLGDDKYKTEKMLSEIAVWKAFIANIGIATIKLICWHFSKSSAMLSEAIHSGVDGFNSLCLIVGLKKSVKPADKLHPYGYGLEANIWALFACILMLAGTAVSLYSGFDKIFHKHDEVLQLLNHYNLIAVTLILSILFEIWAVISASKAVLKESEVTSTGILDTFIKSFAYIKKVKSPTTRFVWYEDTAALLGVIIAFIALTISKFGLPVEQAFIPDAIASIMIGLILLSLAIYLLRHNVYHLTGAGAGPQTEILIKQIATKTHGVSLLHDLKTMDMGSSGLIINMKIEVDPEIPIKDADDIAEKLETNIRAKVKNVAHITIEMLANDAEDDWQEKFDKIIVEGKELGILKPNEAKMLTKFFGFTEKVVYEIMVPRIEVTFIESDSTIDELIDLITISGHTRIPVFKDTTDNIIGVVNAKDVLRATKHKSEFNIEKLAREIPIVPENKSISDMLSQFNKSKSQIAIVADEHGGVAGIVTVEDVIEEIVGEIWDEFDIQIPEIIKIDEHTLNIMSKLDIQELNERFNLDLPTEDFQTVGGYVFGLLGREPEIGDQVQDENKDITFKVLSMDGHKIVRILLTREQGFVDLQELNKE